MALSRSHMEGRQSKASPRGSNYRGGDRCPPPGAQPSRGWFHVHHHRHMSSEPRTAAAAIAEAVEKLRLADDAQVNRPAHHRRPLQPQGVMPQGTGCRPLDPYHKEPCRKLANPRQGSITRRSCCHHAPTTGSRHPLQPSPPALPSSLPTKS